MIISEEQVRLAVDYLRTHDTHNEHSIPGDVPEHLLKRVREVLDTLPETRDERVSEAKDRMETHPPSAEEVAAKIIGRAISDSVR
ncbi:MAG: flagellar biosynthesis anti-sigma factor FlgM [Coriobacteriia bacterium]|nr:flagellar biosynthesis anti-sigma factor FlgM [Coriobacteriia bacterium]